MHTLRLSPDTPLGPQKRKGELRFESGSGSKSLQLPTQHLHPRPSFSCRWSLPGPGSECSHRSGGSDGAPGIELSSSVKESLVCCAD